MGLITKEVEVGINSKNLKHYLDLEYIIEIGINNRKKSYYKCGSKIKVKIEHITKGSHIKVHVHCDNHDCENKNLYPAWKDYLKQVREDGSYYCRKCASVLFGIYKSNIKKMNISMSFYKWCVENNKTNILNRWDFQLNKYKPSEVCYNSSKKYYFKCQNKIHKSELHWITSLISGNKSDIKCIKCNSFAQWGINNLGDDFLIKYWDEYNIVDPWKISCKSRIKVLIKCQLKKYHESYNIQCGHFVSNHRCSYCAKQKTHILDSLGNILCNKGILHIWSDKNKQTPYDYMPQSNFKNIWWRCNKYKHDDYKRDIQHSTICEYRCPKCDIRKGEEIIESLLTLYNIEHVFHKIFSDCRYKGVLEFDFYIPNKNILIEYQGEQHYFPIDFAGRGVEWANENFILNKKRDDIKRVYCKTNNIKLIEVAYWDIKKIKEILIKELNLKGGDYY